MSAGESISAGKLLVDQRKIRRLVLFCAIATFALSATIFLAWASNRILLVAAWPEVFRMQANSALGFSAAGAALGLLASDKPRSAILLAGIALAIGLSTLAEYALGIDLHIDNIFFQDISGSALSRRPPPNTSAVLAALGGAILILAQARQRPSLSFTVQLACFAIIAVAIEALAGRIAGSAFAVSWGTIHGMSIPSAVTAIVMSIGLLAMCWKAESLVATRVAIWVPAMLCFGLVLFDLYTPLEINVGICYIPLVLCALWFPRPQVVIVFAAISTLLIVFGYFASPASAAAIWIEAFNRGLDVVAVWVIASLVYHHHAVARRLMLSERHLASAQRIAAIGSFELNLGTMAFKASDAFETMHGLRGGATHDWIAFTRQSIPPDEREAIDRVIAGARGGGQPQDLEYSFLRKDGVTRNAVMNCELLLSSEGAPASIIGVVHDVTELREAQARQGDIESQLRHAQKVEALGMLAGGIAHDLNNTLAPITTLTPFLLEDPAPSSRESLEVIMDSARRAKQLVREMLIFSRKDPPEREPVHLDLLARNALTIIRAGIPASIAIVDALEPVPAITGSKGQIYQTLLNLATNAAQAIGDRAGTITIGASCDPEPGNQRATVRLSITDDGDGMDEETRNRIFEPFFSTKEANHGTGLGLSIVSGIMKSHGGSILVRSAPGRGTRFDLVFPVAETMVPA